MILDTNTLSAFFQRRPDVVNRISQLAEMHLPVIVLGEYRFGLLGSKKRREWEPKLESFSRYCTLLVVDLETTYHYAAVRHQLKQMGRPIPENDTWIAALARQHNLPILSNDRHFDVVQDISRIGW